jgi:hypothetical protein
MYIYVIINFDLEGDFIQGLLKINEKKPAQSFNVTVRYIDEYFLSLNNSRFGDFVDRIYPIELEAKDTTDADRSASYFKSFSKINRNLVGSIGRIRVVYYNIRSVSS